MSLRKKLVKGKESNFVFRVKMGECEVEICGAREEVLRTIGDLPNLFTGVHKAFEGLKPKTVATLSVKTEAAKEEALMQKYPKIVRPENCEEAVLRVLETDWGKWRPRTVGELKEAFKANGLSYPGRVLAGVLMGLAKKGMVRRWNTSAGYVYILAEKETLDLREKG